MSKAARAELLTVLRQRYGGAPKSDKTRILNEFVAVSGLHRKHAVRLLSGKQSVRGGDPNTGRRIYDEAVREALVIMWESADRICGKRLKAVLPCLVAAMERHGHLELDVKVRARVLSASAATIDRLLVPIRAQAKVRKRRRSASKVSKEVPVRTFADWNEPSPGYLEIDFVVHGGGSMSGSLIHTLVATDVSSGWIECIPLLAREQSLVVEGLRVMGQQFPVPILGIDSDNDGAFINDTLIEYCKNNDIEFTRSRAYQKNDQAWIEQKNGAVVRRFVGHERYSGVIPGQVLAQLYQAIRLYVNFFQPSFKLREKVRVGSKVRKRYHKPATPCERLLGHPEVSASVKAALSSRVMQLDPVKLLHQIRDDQAALAALSSSEDASAGPGRESLQAFLSHLPELWRAGEVRPTHRKSVENKRSWRTRKDPFENVWPDVLRWLQTTPDATAKSMLERLQQERPGEFPDNQLRTLQRRVQAWRHIMARKLVYACVEEVETPEMRVVGI